MLLAAWVSLATPMKMQLLGPKQMSYENPNWFLYLYVNMFVSAGYFNMRAFSYQSVLGASLNWAFKEMQFVEFLH